jgi:hypothetical protein
MYSLGNAAQYKTIRWYIDGVLQTSANDSATFSLSTRGRTTGMNEVLVVVTDNNGLVTSSSTRLNILPEQKPILSNHANYAKAVTVNGLPVTIHDSTSDGNGGLYIVGHQNDTGIMIKQDSEGNVVWFRLPTGTTGRSYLNGVATYNGDIYVSGSFIGTLNFGSGSITGPSSVDNPMVLRFDCDGNNVWAKTSLTGTSYGAFGGIAVNHHGVFVSGWFYYTRDLGDGVVVKTNSWANFDSPWIVKYSHDGKTLWGITSTQNRCAAAGGIVLDNDTLVVTGYTNGSGNSPFSWGNLPVLNGTGYNYNGWCAAFDAVTGTAKWNVLAPVGGTSGLGGVTIHDGYVYTAGYYNPSVYMLNEDANDRGLLVKYDLRNGNVIWYKNDEPVRSRNQDVKADQSGIFVTGYLVNGIKKSVFRKYDTSGINIFTKTVSGSTDSWFGNITIDNQFVYLAGVQTGTASFAYDDISEPVKGNASTENGVLIRYKK